MKLKTLLDTSTKIHIKGYLQVLDHQRLSLGVCRHVGVSHIRYTRDDDDKRMKAVSSAHPQQSARHPSY